jgi:hypothetical protein
VERKVKSQEPSGERAVPMDENLAPPPISRLATPIAEPDTPHGPKPTGRCRVYHPERLRKMRLPCLVRMLACCLGFV